MYPWAVSERLPVSESMYLSGNKFSQPVVEDSDTYFGHLYHDMVHH